MSISGAFVLLAAGRSVCPRHAGSGVHPGSDMGGGVGGLLYSKRRNAAGPHLVASFNLSNGRGDVTTQTDANGNVTWQATYEAFGMSGQHADSGQRSCTSPVASSGVSPIGMMHGFMLVKWKPFGPAPEG